MLFNHCPACRSINRPTARRCEACGVVLADFDTVPSGLTRPGALAAAADSQVGALWFDELGPQPRPSRPSPALPDVTPPAAPPVTSAATAPVVRPLPAPLARAVAASAAPPAVWPTTVPPTPPIGATEWPGMEVREIRLSLSRPPAERLQPSRQPPSAGLAPAPPGSPAMPPPAAMPTDRAARAAIKVARRAAVRRAKQASAPPLQAVTDVLVMDADAVARNRLDDLLGDFGFRVRPVATLSQAALLAAHHPFAAVFVAVPPGAIDGAVHDLFEHVREHCGRAGVAPAVRVLLASQWTPVDRVRAELAGCEATLAQPVSRRDLARVLDANGVVLPRDPRRA